MSINWNTTRQEASLLHKIAKRAVKMAAMSNIEWPLRECEMDITAVHLNGCALDLKRLLAADDFNFGHDVFGIRNNINRTTGQLDGMFCPRFTERQPC